MQNTKYKTGFTLMEMLIVLSVMALLLGVGIPFLSNFTKGMKLKTAANEITAVLNSARSLAITQRSNYSVKFDFASFPHTYYIIDKNNQIYQKKYQLPASILFYRPGDPANPTTFPAHRAVFSSTGGLTTASGSVWISNKKQEIRRITISNTTGRVKIDQEP